MNSEILQCGTVNQTRIHLKSVQTIMSARITNSFICAVFSNCMQISCIPMIQNNNQQ